MYIQGGSFIISSIATVKVSNFLILGEVRLQQMSIPKSKNNFFN